LTDARRFFDAIARRYDRDYALSGTTSRERMRGVVAAIAGKRRVLALGLGTGRELPALLDAGHEVTGLDVSPEMIAQCNKRARTVTVVLADFWEPLPFADGSFDAVIALHGTIAHPPSERSYAELSREIARVLAPGGLFVAEVPAAEALGRIATTEGARRLDAIGRARFVHADATLGISIEGVALDAAEWRAALAPALSARVTPLGDVEHLVVASRG
jgi:SAM-dependent methyltransferase